MLEKKIKHKFALGQEVYFQDYNGTPAKGRINAMNILFRLKEEKEISVVVYGINFIVHDLEMFEDMIFATPEELAKKVSKEIVEYFKNIENVSTKEG